MKKKDTLRAAIIKLLVKLAPILALWFAHIAGRAARDKEQNVVNAKVRKRYKEIEQEHREKLL